MTDTIRPRRGRMRSRAILSEAWRNLTSGTTRAVILALTAAAVLAALTWTEISTITRITHAATAYQNAGASVQVLYAPAGINPVACEALNDVEGIRAAGAIRDVPQKVIPAVTPQSRIDVKEATPGITRLLDLDGTSTQEGLVASRQVANALGLKPGDDLPTTSGAQRIQGIYEYPDDGRMPGYGYAMLSPALPEGRFDACWADIWPENTDTAALLWTALDSAANTTESPPTLGQLNSKHGSKFGGAMDFDTRVTKYNGLVAATGLFLLAYLAVRLRRLELAAALHTGVNKSAQASQLLIETSVWITAAAAITAPVIVLGVIEALPADRDALITTSARIVASGVIAAMIGTLTATALTKEKHLFRYFKER